MLKRSIIADSTVCRSCACTRRPDSRLIARFVSLLAGRWNRFWFQPGSAARLATSRAVFCGAAFLFYLPRDFTEWATAAPVFWMPIRTFEVLHLSPLSAGALLAVQTAWKLALGLCAIGLWTRASAIVAAALGIYLLGLPQNFGATQHYDTLVVFTLTVLAFSRAGDVRSFDAIIRARRRAGRRRQRVASDTATAEDSGLARPTGRSEVRRAYASGAEYQWPIRAMWVMTALVFFGAGTSKLRHSGLEWAFSDNLRLLLMRAYYHVSDGDPLTGFGLTIARLPGLSKAVAVSSLAIETFYIVALFSRRARPYIGIVGVLFFAGIRAFMGPTFEAYFICNLFLVPWDRVEQRARAWARGAASQRAAMPEPGGDVVADGGFVRLDRAASRLSTIWR